MKVLLITGGSSSERKISFLSAENVKEALEESGFEVKLFDLKKGYPSLKKLAQEFDVLFPVIHGREGEDGNLQKFISKLGKPYIGGDPKGVKIAFDKILFKKYCDKKKIPQARWKKIRRSFAEAQDDITRFGFPSVLKAANGGSSKEVVILKSENDLRRKSIEKLLSLDDQFFVEEFLPGIEITVGIFKDKALPVVEIIPPQGGWFDYKNKYSGGAKEIVNAPSLPEKVKRKAQEMALAIHLDLKLGQYSRIDMIVTKDAPYVLEANPIPGTTKTSLYPKAVEATGITFATWAKEVISSALG